MKYYYDIEDIPESGNFAEKMSDDDLNKLGGDLSNRISLDDQSRQGWLKENREWTKLAMQVLERKSTPWENAANVKYPLLTVASIQFHARAQQAVLKGPKPVKVGVVGYDPTGQKQLRAERVGKFLSYQVLHQIDNWEEDMDRMLLLLPFEGLAFKKTYMSVSKGEVVSELVLAKDLIINYHANDFEMCRKTHIIPMESNQVHEMIKLGFYLNVDLAPPNRPEQDADKDWSKTSYTYEDEDIPRRIHECHCWVDLDGDGYKEPWIVTLDADSNKILRIAPRSIDVRRNMVGEITHIDGDNMFTRFYFLPDPRSKIYSMGLGTLVGPINSSVNTLINQLTDAGTLAVLPSGFLGRGIKNSRGGAMRFRPGEWKGIPSTGDDLRKSIFPLPVKEPSNVLFQLLGMLVESGRQVGSIADIMMGENPGQNQPYSTTVQVLEQGMKVFVGIYKRLYRSLGQEYKKLYKLDALLPGEVYMNVLDGEMLQTSDFEDQSLDIVPSGDPDMVAEGQRLLRAESLFQKMAAGLPVNPQEATKRILEAEEHADIKALMEMPPPQPDFEVQFKTKQHEDLMNLEKQKLQLNADTAGPEKLKDIAQAMVNLAKARNVGTQEEISKADLMLREAKDAADAYLAAKKEDREKAASNAEGE